MAKKKQTLHEIQHEKFIAFNKEVQELCEKHIGEFPNMQCQVEARINPINDFHRIPITGFRIHISYGDGI